MLHKSAKILLAVALVLAGIYSVIVLMEEAEHEHLSEEQFVHGDHIHTVYQPVIDITSENIQFIEAYFPPENRYLVVRDRDVSISELNGTCEEFERGSFSRDDMVRVKELSEREAREMRNLYSKITPDSRIENPSPDETYGLTDPEACIAVHYEERGENQRDLFRVGQSTAQGFSRYITVDPSPSIYVISSYFYTELLDFLE